MKGRCNRRILKFEVFESLITDPRLVGRDGIERYEGVDQFVEKWEKEKGLESSVKYDIK